MDSTPPRALSIDYKEKEKAKAKPSDDATGNPGDAGICPFYLGSGLKDHKIHKMAFRGMAGGTNFDTIYFPTEETMKVAESSIGHHLSEEEAKKRADDEYFKRITRVTTTAAGEPYNRKGDYVCLLNAEEEENSEEERDGCSVCYQDHMNMECPWILDDSVPACETVGRWYDLEYKGCGKVGSACCSEGARPVLRRCGLCFDFGHWMENCQNYKYMPVSEFPDYP